MRRNTLKYKGYTGLAEVDFDDGLIHGRVLGIEDVVSFEGETTEAARADFEAAVDDYIEQCRAEGKEPGKAYSGQFNLRISPELHRAAAEAADVRGQSLNALVESALARVVAAGEWKGRPPGPTGVPGGSESADPSAAYLRELPPGLPWDESVCIISGASTPTVYTVERAREVFAGGQRSRSETADAAARKPQEIDVRLKDYIDQKVEETLSRSLSESRTQPKRPARKKGEG